MPAIAVFLPIIIAYISFIPLCLRDKNYIKKKTPHVTAAVIALASNALLMLLFMDFGAALEFTADLFHQLDIHLVIQEAVHLQHIAGLDDAVFYDSFFQKVHTIVSPLYKTPSKGDRFYFFSHSLGITRFIMMAARNTTATQFSANTVRIMSGKMLNISGTWVKPRPMLRDRAAMVMLR